MYSVSHTTITTNFRTIGSLLNFYFQFSAETSNHVLFISSTEAPWLHTQSQGTPLSALDPPPSPLSAAAGGLRLMAIISPGYSSDIFPLRLVIF